MYLGSKLYRRHSFLHFAIAAILTVTWSFLPIAIAEQKMNSQVAIKKVAQKLYRGKPKRKVTWRMALKGIKPYLTPKTYAWLKRELKPHMNKPLPKMDFVKNKVIFSDGSASGTLELVQSSKAFIKINGVPFSVEEARHPKRHLKKYRKAVKSSKTSHNLELKTYALFFSQWLETAQAASQLDACWSGQGCNEIFPPDCKVVSQCLAYCEKQHPGENAEKQRQQCKSHCYMPRETKVYWDSKNNQVRRSMRFSSGEGEVILHTGLNNGAKGLNLESFCAGTNADENSGVIDHFCAPHKVNGTVESGKGEKAFTLKNTRQEALTCKREPRTDDPREDDVPTSGSQTAIGVLAAAAVAAAIAAILLSDDDDDPPPPQKPVPPPVKKTPPPKAPDPPPPAPVPPKSPHNMGGAK